MRRAMQVLQGLGPQESRDTYYFPYDHPYFGQLFLAGIFKLIGYPGILNPEVGNLHSIEMLYLVPRVLMGLLAVLDTFLIYKIAERKYNRTVAFIAAIFFAVMPFGWILRRVLLDSIQLPLILSSILCALYTSNAIGTITNNRNKLTISLINISILASSGIFLGLAIFTKILAFTMIPLIAYLVLHNSRNQRSDKNERSFKVLALWFIPVIMIPLTWPIYSIVMGNFDEWIDGVLWQTTRTTRSLSNTIEHIFLKIDPLLIVITIAGFIYAQLRKDYFLLLWAIPYLITLFLVDWVYFFHFIQIFPAFCISAAILFADLLKKNGSKIRQYLSFSVVSSIFLVSLSFTIILINSNLNSQYMELVAFLTQVVHNNGSTGSNNEKIAVIGPNGSWSFIWAITYIFERNLDFKWFDHGSNYLEGPITNEKLVLIADREMRYSIFLSNSNEEHIMQIKALYSITHPVRIFNNSMYGDDLGTYPHTNYFDDFFKVGNITKMRGIDWSREIEIRSNYSVS
jgi:Dolichyl-phosphate-mannose-protein mannosyltransferase